MREVWENGSTRLVSSGGGGREGAEGWTDVGKWREAHPEDGKRKTECEKISKSKKGK